MPSTATISPGSATLPPGLLTAGADPLPGGTTTTTTTGAAASASAKPAGAGATSGTAAARAPATRKAATSKASGAKASGAKAGSAQSSGKAAQPGYATSAPAGYEFLRDPRLSLEEKLSRFIGMVLTRSEQDLLAQMERMAGSPAGAQAGAAGAKAGASATGAGAAKPKASKTSLWGLAKSLLPPLGLAAKVVGDSALKSLVQKVTGPVLAAAATAVGLPALAPLALKYGPGALGALADQVASGLSALTGGGSTPSSGASGSGGASSTTSGSPAAGGATSGAVGTASSEKAQLMELQRLQDRDKELFTLFSNMLRSMHDARMTAIQNLR